MIVLVPKAFTESKYGSDKHALKIVSRIVCDNIQKCADFRSACAAEAKREGRYCERVAKAKPTNPQSVLGSWINFHSYDLRSITSNYPTICKDLERDGWIRKNRHYSNFSGTRKFPYSFGLQSNWYSEPLKLFRVKQRLTRNKYRCVVGDAGGDLNREYSAAENFLDSFTLPEEKVEEWDALCELSSWPDWQRYLIAMMSQRTWWSHVDEYGRYHSPLTNLSKRFRKYIECEGENIIGFDFVNFQPALLTLQQLKQIPEYEYEKYSSICKNEDIYLYMRERCSHYKTRDEVKTDFLAMLNKKNQYMVQMELFKSFAVSFPNYASLLQVIKKDDHRDMTRYLQYHESQIIYGGIVRTYMKETISPFLTIHDAVFVPCSQRDTLKDTFKKYISIHSLPVREEEEELFSQQSALPIYVSMNNSMNTTRYQCGC
jgi:hypothetical protein